MSLETTELSCFVISPIGDRNAAIGTSPREIWEQNIQTWEEVIQPACAGVGLTPVRADQISEAGDITDQVFRKLRDSHVVIADLTGANPNVMYELGLRHTTGKLTVQIGEDGRLPFDVSTIRTIRFKRTAGGLVDARRALVQALATGVEGRFTPIMATRVWLEAPEVMFSPTSNLSLESARAESTDEEPGFLEILADMEPARSEMMTTLVAIGNVIKEVGAHIGTASEQLSNAGGASAPIAAKIAIANSLADQLEDPATRLESLSVSFADSLRRSDPGTKLIIEELKKDPKTSQEQLGRMREQYKIQIDGLAATQRFRDSLATSRVPTKAQGKQYRRIARALDAQIAVQPIVQTWLHILDDVLGS